MATVVYCPPEVLGRVPKVWCERELGSASPLEFHDGHAVIEDDGAARALVRSRPGIEYAGSHPDADPDYFENGAGGASSDSSPDEGEASDGGPNAAEADTCGVTIQRTGEPCGRDLPCPYHSD